MGVFTNPARPYVPPLPAAPPPAPTTADPDVVKASQATRSAAAAASGYGSTIATGGQGVTTPSATMAKQLLGL